MAGDDGLINWKNGKSLAIVMGKFDFDNVVGCQGQTKDTNRHGLALIKLGFALSTMALWIFASK